jgi:hypothetical protein
MKPVMNAEMEVIDYVCVCKPAFACKSASERHHASLNTYPGGRGGRDNTGGNDGSSAAAAAPVVIDASSTSMTAGQSHGRPGASADPSAGGDGADVATLFSVSFYNGASTAPSAAAAAVTSTSTGNAITTTQGAAGREEAAPVKGEAKEDDDRLHGVDSDNSSADSIHLPFPASPESATATSVTAQQQQPAAQRARSRYYDPAQGAGGGRGGGAAHSQPAKVCWNCGMTGHEKPACPNTLCRTCHQLRGPYGVPHRCAPVTIPSSFIVLPTASAWKAELMRLRAPGEAEGMSAVRCVACGRDGHFDCSVAVSGTTTTTSSSSSAQARPADAVPLTTPFTCCYCGVRGHTVFECRQRDRAHPDHFERRQQLAAENLAAGGCVHNNVYGNSDPGGSYGQQQQQSYGGAAGSSSANTTRFGNTSSNRSYEGSNYSGGNGYRRDRTGDGDDVGSSRTRRRYEAPQLNSRDYPSSRSVTSGIRYNSPSSPQQRQRQQQPQHSRGDSYASYGEQDSRRRDDRYNRRDSRGGGHCDNRHDRHERREHHSSGHGDRRRGKNRDYDSGDDLF